MKSSDNRATYDAMLADRILSDPKLTDDELDRYAEAMLAEVTKKVRQSQ